MCVPNVLDTDIFNCRQIIQLLCKIEGKNDLQLRKYWQPHINRGNILPLTPPRVVVHSLVVDPIFLCKIEGKKSRPFLVSMSESIFPHVSQKNYLC